MAAAPPSALGSSSASSPAASRSSADATLAACSRGFRDRYLPFEEVTAQLAAWAAAFPAFVKLTSLGKTPEGRDLWVLTVGDDAAGRPAVWIDGNMHATELCGSSVALAIAEDAIRLHADPDATLVDVPPAVARRARDVVFHIMPRMSPDGAECVLSTARYVRSVPRDERAAREKPRWIAGDVDGDGLALLMRVVDEAGDYVEHPKLPGVLAPRGLDDEGPFYRLYPEGHIEHFDGAAVPVPTYLSDNDPDLNRNFPSSWMPEPDQLGAGRYATSEPESRAVVEFVSARPNIFAWLNLHTYGGCFIRPLGDAPDTKMNEEDLAIFREIGAVSERLTGYPMVSGFEEFTYAPDTPLRGDLSDFAYLHRGAIAYVCELWDLFAQLGIERPKRFVDFYRLVSRESLERLAELDRTRNEGRIFRPWKKVVHRQLGEVEVGGLDPRVGISNPPLKELGEVCRRQSAAFLHTASLLPKVVLRADVVREGAVARVDVHVENHGYLSTLGLPSAKRLTWNEELVATATASGGLSFVAAPKTGGTDNVQRVAVGHLDGWGRGKDAGAASIWFAKSRGNQSRAVVRFTVSGSGVLEVVVKSCRVGAYTLRVEV